MPSFIETLQLGLHSESIGYIVVGSVCWCATHCTAAVQAAAVQWIGAEKRFHLSRIVHATVAAKRIRQHHSTRPNGAVSSGKKATFRSVRGAAAQGQQNRATDKTASIFVKKFVQTRAAGHDRTDKI